MKMLKLSALAICLLSSNIQAADKKPALAASSHSKVANYGSDEQRPAASAAAQPAAAKPEVPVAPAAPVPPAAEASADEKQAEAPKADAQQQQQQGSGPLAWIMSWFTSAKKDETPKNC